MIILAIAGGGALVTTLWATSCITVVKQKHETVIESFGKYKKTITEPGLKFKQPWPLQTVAAKIPTYIQQHKETLRTKSKDDVFVELPIEMQLRVCDTNKAVYESDQPIRQISTKVSEAIKSQASKMDFAELYEAREDMIDYIRENLAEYIKDTYGYEIVDVIVDEPRAPEAIERAYNEVKASERRLQSATNDAEAEKIRVVKGAEARKEAQGLLGEGIADQRAAIFENYSAQFNKLIADGMNAEEASKMMALAMTQDTLRDIGEQGNLIIASADGADQLANFQALGQKLTNDNKPNPKRTADRPVLQTAPKPKR